MNCRCTPFIIASMSIIPTIEPGTATAGDTIQWSKSLPDYPASAGWVLKYALRGVSGSIDITCTASGPSYLASGILPATAGEYTLQGFVTNGAEKHTIYSGKIKLTPDISAVSGTYDGRSHAKRVLDAIESVIEGRATRGDQELTIDGTRLVRMTAEQLKLLRTYYRNEYNAEQRAENVRNGRGSGRKVVVRFTK